MAKVNPTVAPDFTEEERKWIEAHPFWRVVFMLVRLALVPAMIAGISAYFEYRSSHNDKKIEASLVAVSPEVERTAKQVAKLTEEVELLRKLVLTIAVDQGARTAESIGFGNMGTIGHGTGGVSSPPPSAGGANAALRPLMTLQAEARSRKDLVALNCVTEKLSAARRALRAHETSKIASLTREAKECVGQAILMAAPPASKADLVQELQKSKPAPFEAKPLPKSANDALQQLAR